VERTRTSLRNALIGLAREKPYDAVAVKEILDRANVGRSTFYMHFRDKDDLLESGIREMLQAVYGRPRPGSAAEQVLAFSRPILEYVDRHRCSDGPRMTRHGRLVMHEHLEEVLAVLIADDVATAIRRQPAPLPSPVLARHVASTFVLLLNWWVESEASLTAAQVDARFRGLVLPALTAT
jgi:AcrR family transcriptional regulator